jgi:hypothetical protein
MTKRSNESGKGSLVARILAGSWRRDALTELHFSQSELEEVTPLLYGSGAAALGWWRIRETDLHACPSAEVMHQAYRLQALLSGIHEQKIQKVFRVLRTESIEPILVKGWAAASLYPDQALRPYGDIDLCVKQQEFKAAQVALARPEMSECWVDLHKHFEGLEDRRFEELFSRSHLIDLEDEGIRVLSDEDHLALMAIHLLKHGAWRPLWLCDIGAALESLPAGFDWDLCLGGNKRRANWVVCAIGLANRLLSADIEAMPIERRPNELPAWLLSNVLYQWSRLFPADHLPIIPPPLMLDNLSSPRALFVGIRQRWPDPVTATFNLRGEFDAFPRLPYQVGDFLLKAGRFLIHPRGIN